MLKEYLNELKQKTCPIAPSSFSLGDGVLRPRQEVQRVGAVIRNCGAQPFLGTRLQEALSLCGTSYRGVGEVDTVIDVDNLQSRSEKGIPTCDAA
jgi:hypothetical protein